jgi:hypothetical protein
LRYLTSYQKERKDDTSYEQPLADIKWNGDTSIVLRLRTTLKDLVRPCFTGQHGGSGEDIRKIDEERLEYDDIKPKVPELEMSEDHGPY